MFSLKTLSNQLHLQSRKHFVSKRIQRKSTIPKRTPAFDEMYTDVVDRLINKSKLKSEAGSKKSNQEATEASQKPKPNVNIRKINLKISKNGDQIIGSFSK